VQVKEFEESHKMSFETENMLREFDKSKDD